MKTSQLYAPTRREASSQIEHKSHILLLRAGFIRQLSAGLYYLLPLGTMVLRHIMKIIHERMQHIGMQEISMPVLQPVDLLKESQRYTVLESLLMQCSLGEKKNPFCLTPTCEESILNCVRQDSLGYKELPFSLYHIQLKFRNELRARSGLLRCREFYMFDGYSFHSHLNSLHQFYHLVYEQYCHIFNQLSLNYLAASADNGDMGGAISHEFHALADCGEDEFLHHPRNQVSFVKDLIPQHKKGEYVKKNGIEIGHIFQLSSHYSQPMQGCFMNQKGQKQPYEMGCYGIGVSRLMAAVVEQHHDAHGIIWPASISPFLVIILPLGKDETLIQEAYQLYQMLQEIHVEVLLEDRQMHLSQMLSNADLIGVSYQVLIKTKSGVPKIILRQRQDKKETPFADLSAVAHYFAVLSK